MCRHSRQYLYRAEGTPKLFTIHYSLFTRKAPPCAPVAFIYKFSFVDFVGAAICRTREADSLPYEKFQIVLLLSVI